MGAAEMKAGHEEEYVDGTSAAPWPQLDGVRPKTSPSLVDDGRGGEDGEGRGGAKYDTPNKNDCQASVKLTNELNVTLGHAYY